MSVYRLLFVSTVSLQASRVLPSTVEDILFESLPRNARDKITGLLLCDGFSFFQVIEGARAKVEACYARIERDARHTDVTLRLRGRVARRMFPRWSMCGLTLSDRDDLVFQPGDIEFDLRQAAPGAVLQHLWGIAARHAAELDTLHNALMARYGATPTSHNVGQR
jgi:hypothetical protein